MAEAHTEEAVDERLTEPGLPSPGTLIGEFRVQKPIGVGGCGAVFQAYQERLDRDVAIKVLLPSAAARFDGLAKRFLREIDIVKRLEHPNVVRMYDFGQTDGGLLWMAMELVRGRELAQLINTGEMLDPDRCKHVMLQILSALSEAHEQNIVHRDLKPGNIMLTRKGADEDVVKLLDFGIGKALGEGENSAVQNLTTNNGDAYGTPRYMAPELLLKENVGPHVDVYAVGLILYELITGSPAVVGETVYEILARQLQEDIDFPSWLAPTELGRVIATATHKDHEERYQSALEFHRALRKCDVREIDALRSGKISPRVLADTGRTNIRNAQPDTGEVQAQRDPTMDTPPHGVTEESTGPVGIEAGDIPVANASSDPLPQPGSFAAAVLASSPALPPAVPALPDPDTQLSTDRSALDADSEDLVALMGSGDKKKWILIGVAGAVVVLLIVILAVSLGGSDADTDGTEPEADAKPDNVEETAPTPPPESQEKVEWRFESTPEGATVQVNSRAICAATPCAAEIRKVDRPVTVFFQLEGYRAISRTIVPTAPDTLTVEFQERVSPGELLGPDGQLLPDGTEPGAEAAPTDGDAADIDSDHADSQDGESKKKKKKRRKRVKVPSVVD